MIQQSDIEYFPGISKPICNNDIARAGFNFTAGVVVEDDDREGVI